MIMLKNNYAILECEEKLKANALERLSGVATGRTGILHSTVGESVCPGLGSRMLYFCTRERDPRGGDPFLERNPPQQHDGQSPSHSQTQSGSLDPVLSCLGLIKPSHTLIERRTKTELQRTMRIRQFRVLLACEELTVSHSTVDLAIGKPGRKWKMG